MHSQEQPHPRIICLANIHDQHYHEVRGEKIHRCLTTPFRSDMYHCLELASGRKLVMLSSPPKAAERLGGRWLPPTETRFATHQQLFCGNWDVPKLRVPLSWFFYVRHALKHVRSGDLVIMDNYEFIYVLAARVVALFRRVKFGVIYLDGKHLMDRSWARLLSGMAEWAGRPLMSFGFLANQAMANRLSSTIPIEHVPGFYVENKQPVQRQTSDQIHFLYTGSLDRERGIEMLLAALDLLPENGWRLTIAGSGPLTDLVIRKANEPRWCERVAHRNPASPEIFNKWLAEADVGLSCQMISDPITNVTFPSKIFTYLSAGLLVISSPSDSVKSVCGPACLYFDGQTPESLAEIMREVIADFSAARNKVIPTVVSENYSMTATAGRLRKVLEKVGVITESH